MAAGAASSDSVVTEECLVELLDFFIKSAYKARNADRRVSRWGGRLGLEGRESENEEGGCYHNIMSLSNIWRGSGDWLVRENGYI